MTAAASSWRNTLAHPYTPDIVGQEWVRLDLYWYGMVVKPESSYNEWECEGLSRREYADGDVRFGYGCGDPSYGYRDVQLEGGGGAGGTHTGRVTWYELTSGDSWWWNTAAGDWEDPVNLW